MTYDELRAALSAYMKRTDPETIANEPTALELSRQAVGRLFFPVESEVEADLILIDGQAVLPDDFGRAVSVGNDMAYTPPRAWRWGLEMAPNRIGGKYSIYDDMIHVAPSLLSLRVVYNRQPEAISGTQSNWLSEHYPAVWLHAARAEQYRFIEDNEGAAGADSIWQGLAAELGGASEISRQAGGALRMKGR